MYSAVGGGVEDAELFISSFRHPISCCLDFPRSFFNSWTSSTVESLSTIFSISAFPAAPNSFSLFLFLEETHCCLALAFSFTSGSFSLSEWLFSSSLVALVLRQDNGSMSCCGVHESRLFINGKRASNHFR